MQSVSPGTVRTQIAGDTGFFDNLAHLQPEDISQGVLYALATPAHVNVSELCIRPIGDIF